MSIRWAWLLAATCCALPANAGAQAHADADAECAVWQREASFAQSVQARDANAFREHLQPDAVFSVGSDRALVGSDAVGEGWAAIVAGKDLSLRWWPEFVHVNARGDIAHSSGPYLMGSRDAAGEWTHGKGRFSSVWARSADGAWRVLFDGGTPPTPVDAAEAKAMAARPAGECPGRKVVRVVRRR